MKKIVTIGAIAAIAGGMMFAQPVFEPSVTLDGSATAKWGVALDAGQTGFQNDTSGDFKVKLWGDGSRELEEGDGVWAELKVTGKETTINKGKLEGGDWELNTAKLHLGPVYIGVTSGDTQVGEYKFDGAIRSADNDHAKYLNNVGPDKFSQGIVVGFANDSFDVGVDFRSYYDDDEEKGTNTKYTSAYAFAAEAKILDTNEFLPGLAFDAGVGYNFSDHYTIKEPIKVNDEVVGGKADTDNYYAFDGEALEKLVFGYVEPEKPAAEDSATLKTLKEELKALEEGYADWKSGKPGTYAANSASGWATVIKNKKDAVEAQEIDDAQAKAAENYQAPAAHLTDRAKETKVHTLGYAFNASYKLAIDDTFYVKPAVGLTGTYVSAKNDTSSASASVNTLAFGALFGWGDTADANAGVYFLDGDGAKKVTPGISVVAAIPLASTSTETDNSGTYKTTAHSALQALIVPSVYLGELVPNLKFGAYSEMALLRNYKDGADLYNGNTAYKYTGNNTEAWTYAKTKDNAAKEARTFGLAAAFGVAYDIKATDDVTITPKFGLRYANSAYVQNKVGKIAPLASDGLFEAGYEKMGMQQDTTDGKHPDGDIDNYLNIKFGVDAAGLINNTTFFVEYSSANLLYDGTANPNDLNWYKEQNKYYSVKAGYLDIGCKISF